MMCLQDSLNIDLIPGLKTPVNKAISGVDLYQVARSSFSTFPFLLGAVLSASLNNFNMLIWKL